MLRKQLQQIALTPDPAYDAGLGMLTQVFQSLDPHYLDRAPAAVCVLFRGQDFSRSQVLLTLRSGTVTTHAHQVAFPGGSLDPTDDRDPRRAALRECREEVGIEEPWIETHGVLDPFPTFGGNFLVQPVLASARGEGTDAPLILDPREVVFAEWVPVAQLIARRQLEERGVFSHTVKAPYFMWGDNKMWGLSAWIFDSILNRYATISL